MAEHGKELKRLYLPCWNGHVVASYYWPWNAWVVKDDGRQLYHANGMLEALEHMLFCEKCRAENRLSITEVHQMLKELEHKKFPLTRI